MEVTLRRRGIVVVAAIVSLGAAACGADDPAGSTTIAPTTVAPTTASEAPASTVPDGREPDPADLPERVPGDEGTTVVGEVPKELLDPVIADAASRAGVEASTITVVTAQEMMWPDGSLGCAEPGGIYTQAIVPGYWVIVEAGGVAYDYRLDANGFFKLCTSPFPGPGDTAPDS